jgi:hypothetical protein
VSGWNSDFTIATRVSNKELISSLLYHPCLFLFFSWNTTTNPYKFILSLFNPWVITLAILPNWSLASEMSGIWMVSYSLPP